MYVRYYLIFSYFYKKPIKKWQFLYLKDQHKLHKKINVETFKKIGIFLTRDEVDHVESIREERDVLSKKQRLELAQEEGDSTDYDS